LGEILEGTEDRKDFKRRIQDLGSRPGKKNIRAKQKSVGGEFYRRKKEEAEGNCAWVMSEGRRTFLTRFTGRKKNYLGDRVGGQSEWPHGVINEGIICRKGRRQKLDTKLE